MSPSDTAIATTIRGRPDVTSFRGDRDTRATRDGPGEAAKKEAPDQEAGIGWYAARK